MKRALKISVICLVSIILIVVLTVIGFRLYYNDDRLRAILIDLAEENTGGKAELGHLEISGFLQVHLRDLEIRNLADDSMWFCAGDVQISVKPAGLLTGDLHISDMTVENVYIDYGNLPVFPQADSGALESREGFQIPVDLLIDRFELKNFAISGPEAKLGLEFSLADFRFSGPDNFSGSYMLSSNQGSTHYTSDDFSVKGNFNISADGEFSSKESCSQRLKIVFPDIELIAGDSVSLEDFSLSVNTFLNYGAKTVAVNDIVFARGEEEIIAFEGDIERKEPPEISLRARERGWELSELNSLLRNLNIELQLSGIVSLKELNISAKTSDFSYNFEINLEDVGIDYANFIYLGGLNGDIYSDGGQDLFVFGSSLSLDSLGGRSEAGPLFSVYGISSAVEAEVSASEFYLNMNTDASDFMGGKFDINAFTQKSKIDGEIRIDNVNISKASSGMLAGEGIELNGIFDLILKISGRTDSVLTEISANLEEFKIRLENDSLYIPQQEFKLSASTRIGKDAVNSDFKYGIQKVILGEAQLHYPLKPALADSIIMTYKMNLDNSVLPSYLPSAVLDALGAVELSGGSVIDGRFASPADRFVFTGSSKLKIEPTDILIDDLQSVLYSLISVSEFQLTEGGMSLSSNSGIEDLFNENYSDLDFSGITIEGEIVSLSDTTWRITFMTVNIPSLKSSLNILGDFGYANGAPFSNLNIYYTFKADEPLEIVGQYYLGGELKAEFRTFTVDTLLEFSGTARLNNFDFESRNAFKISGLDGSIPVSGKINLQDSMFVVPSDKHQLPGSEYQRARLANLMADEYGRMKIGRIEADPFFISDVNIDLGFKSGVLNIPYLTGSLLGGDFYGALLLDLTDVNLMREIPNYESLRYQLDFEMSDLDFNQLSYNMGPSKDRADFAADAHFNGSGIIAPGEEYAISGKFHITKMGPGVAERVLDIMDPENANPSIVQTKELLNRKILGLIDMSYKPKKFSFELKHGALYPRLYMDQPFFADVVPLIRIPMPVEYGRIPVKSLIANLKEESW